MAVFGLSHCVVAQRLPPGVVKVDTLYIDQSEVTNISWLEYLHYLKKDSSESVYIEALPDTTVWYQVYDSAIADPLYNYSYRYPGFSYMPIVGLTQEQAINYCHWRTKAVRQSVLSDTARYAIADLEYRLPSESEWEYIARRNQTYRDSYIKKKQLKSRIPEVGQLRSLAENLNYDIEIKRIRNEIKQFYIDNPILLLDNLNTKNSPYFKAILGVGTGLKYISFYDVKVENLRGNVSELTLTPGIARGGNWTLTEQESAVNVRVEYDGPSALLGFRCLCEIEFLN